MSKVMSLLEKCNLVEKVSEEPATAVKDDDYGLEPNTVINDDVEEVEVKNEPVPEPVAEIEPINPEPIKNFEEKMRVSEIYSNFGLKNSSINTVFMLENFINALPQTLPKDVLKQSVINIMEASNINLNELIYDGEQRLKVLSEVLNGYNSETIKKISEYKEEISRLTSLINNCQRQIELKEAMLEDQTYMIKCESEKIEGIIGYFSK
ncbi:MAG: hypothetical protein ACM3X7_13530 [Solirubrobacterales bacterium]